MTLDEELALIRKNKSPAALAVPAPAAPSPTVDVTPADLPPAETGLEPLPRRDASTWDVIGAGWTAETIRTDAWSYTQNKRSTLSGDLFSRLPADAKQRIMARRWDYQNNWIPFEDMVLDEVAKAAVSDPKSWGNVPLSRAAFDAQIRAERHAELGEAQTVLDQPGGGFAEFLGSGARAMTDEISLAMAPLGVGGGALRTIVAEAALGGLGEAAILPREFRVADELDLPTPDIWSRIGMGAVLGGGLSAGVLAIAKGVGLMRARSASTRDATPAGGDALRSEIEIDKAEAGLLGEQTVQEVINRAIVGNYDKGVSTSAATAMDRLQSAWGSSLNITSQFRSPEHNAAVGGARNSQHTHGNAFDVDVKGLSLAERNRLIIEARNAGFSGIGVYANSLHFDVGGDRAWGPNYHRSSLPDWAAEAVSAPLGNSSEWQIDGATLRAIIGAESGGNPTAKNPSGSAYGVGQFIASTWMVMIRKYRPDLTVGKTDSEILSLRGDGAISTEMTAMYARENAALLTANGLPAEPGTIYMAHFMGPGGAVKALKSPLDTPIAQLMSPKEIAANKGIRYGGKSFADFTAGDLRRWAAHKMRGAYDPSASRDMPDFSGGTSRGYTGTNQVAAGDDFRIDVEYEVVDIASLIRATGDFQPRDRSRVNSDAWIADTAARLDPALLMRSPSADRGAPIVGPDNMVESGNGRFAAIQRAYELHPDRADMYRAQIAKEGFAVPEGMQRPILIARRKTEFTNAERGQFAIAAQDSGVAMMTPTEIAQASARSMTPEMLAMLDPGEDMASAVNRPFVKRALESIPRSTRNAMFGDMEALNSYGVMLMQHTLFARAWPDADIIRRFAEGGDSDFKSLLDALEEAAPDWAALRGDIEAGRVSSQMDISGHILEAMRLITKAREEASRISANQTRKQMRAARTGGGKKDGTLVNSVVSEMLDAVDMMEGALSPLTVRLVRKFWPNGRAASSDDIADFLIRYAEEARTTGSVASMFDSPGPRDVLASIDPKTFGDLPQDMGAVRPVILKGGEAPQVETPVNGYDTGAASPEAEAADSAVRDALSQPMPAGVPQAAAEIMQELGPNSPRRVVDGGRLDPAEFDILQRELKNGQPYRDADSLIAAAERNHDALNDAAAEAAAELGMTFKRAPVKKLARVIQKVADKYAGDFRKIADVARTGIIAPTLENADAFVAALGRRFHLIDEGWITTTVKYTDRKLIVRFDDGQLGEIQIWPPGMLEAKGEGGGHKLYEISRDPIQSPAAREQADTDMVALYAKVRDQLDPSYAEKLGIEARRDASAPVTSLASSSMARSSDSTSSAIGRDPASGDQVLSDAQILARPPSDTAASSLPSNLKNFMEGAPSTLQDDHIIGRPTGEVNSDATAAGMQAELAAARADLGDELANMTFDLEDGTSVSFRDVLDDLDADATLAAAVRACAITPGAR